MNNRVDTIFLKTKEVLQKPEVKEGIKWTAALATAMTVLLSIILSNGIFFYPKEAQATDTPATIAGTGTNATGIGTKPWTTPEEITVTGGGDDSVYAEASLAKSEISNYLKGTNFGFTVPDGSTILGITVEVDRKEGNLASAGGVIDNAVQLIDEAGAMRTTVNYADTVTFWPTTDAVKTYGSTSDTWGEAAGFWTVAKINDPDFGVAFVSENKKVSGGGAAESAHVDFIRVTVSYGPPAITVGTTGIQTGTINIPSTNQYIGGAFTMVRSGGTANVTSIVISETDTTLSAQSYLSNVQLYYKQEVSCSGSIPGDATLYNATGVSFDVSENATVIGTMTVGASQICIYVELDVLSGAPASDTIEIEITNPSTEVTVSAGDVNPATSVAISGATSLYLPPNVFQDHYRWRNDNGPQGNQSQTLYFNPTGNGYGTAEFGIVGGCTAGSEWDCVDDDTVDTSSTQPTSDLETSQLLLAAATDYYTLADNVLLSGSTITQLDITVSGADDVGNPNTSVTLGYCIICDGANNVMGSAQNITGADQTKTQQFTGLSLSTTDLNNMQLVITASGNRAEISTLYVLVTYSVPEATWAQLEDTPHTGLDKSTNIRLRFQVDNTGGSATNYNYRLEYAARGADSLCDTSYSQETYYAVPDSPTTEHFDMTLSNAPGYVGGEPTTAKLSNAEVYTFVAGNTVESTSNQTGNITLAQNEYTEAEYVFQANTNATNGGVYCLRVTNAGTVLNSADAVAQVTLSGGGNSAPNNPSSLAQKKTDDTVISTGGWINQTSVKFTATASDTDNPDTLQLCVEKDLLGTGFSNTEDACGTGVAYSGTPVTVTVTISGIIDSSEYHWQARIKDAASAYSGWVSYDINLESARDFGIDTTAPTGGTVKDGTGADQDWNNGSLSVIDGNWTGTTPDSSSSGLLKYEYAIRRQSDSWYWNNSTWQSGEFWTDNGTGTSFTKSSMNLQTGATYYISLKTTDNAGNAATINSNGQQVSPTLSFSFDSNLVTFSDLNNSNNWTDTKTTTLTVSTNASAGYTIKASINQLLTSIAYPAQTIANFIGTWATPQNWLNFCKDDSNDCGFGYTSNDTLVQSSNRFSGGTLFAAYSGTSPGDVVADHTDPVNGSTGAVSNEQFTITHKVSVSSSQAASTYQTTAIFVITANY